MSENVSIFVYCDDPWHAKRVAVTNFVQVPAGPLSAAGWHERPASRATPHGHVGTGATLVGDTVPEPGWALDPDVSNGRTRDRHTLECRKCHRPRVVREETLFRALDAVARARVSELSLTDLDAILVTQHDPKG